jgi:pilus assembly protein Flp/PilA
MARFASIVRKFARREEGASVVETAVLIALLILVCVAAIRALGGGLSSLFTAASNTI